MDFLTFIGNTDPKYVESQYQQFLTDPLSVDPQWRLFFEGFSFAQKNYPVKHNSSPEFSAEFQVLNLINAYRERGHYFTSTNPVRTRRKYSPNLDIENFGLKKSDLQITFHAGNELGIGSATLQKIIDVLQQTYCQSIGVEFMYIRKVEVVDWIRSRMESDRNTPHFSKAIKHRILESITKAVGFEKFVHKKFPGFKSFSLEGAESLIPAIESVIERAASMDYKEFVIGMPHRGRLNVLTNILHKPYEAIFKEFGGIEFDDPSLLGDVKYHLGYSSDTISADGKQIHLTLSPNPSHLEAVNPVVEGIVRATAENKYDKNFRKTLPFLIHGDAALAGQGIIYEILQMSELPGYQTGGTIHFVVNNQLGFTTNYADGRSSIYCTDIAKIIQSPIFHVNGDDVEAVVHTALMALDFRDRFQKDVFVDLLCYRKYGHNESDEPRFTQPLLYKIIEKHPNPLEIYLKKLQDDKSISSEDFSRLREEFNQQLEQEFFASKKSNVTSIKSFLSDNWSHIHGTNEEEINHTSETAVSHEKFMTVADKLCFLPENVPFFRKITSLQQERKLMVLENRIDWAMAELLAFGTLLEEKFPVRLSGQDVKRGTFSQRHAALIVEDSEEEFIPLQHLSPDQAKIEIYNSPLSEYGVLGFEYGYALASPDTLTVWEAQFGDFNNGAQIIIDQFLVAAEEKWKVWNGLVMLLPHGFEGQGPEHSSGRMERFLSACASLNIQVANCALPSNYFHLLRRQLHRPFRKPLVVFTPKSLLRNPACVSSVEEFTTGNFKEVITDDLVNYQNVTRVIFCTGKVYYDLLEARHEKGRMDTAIIRIEQLYPFPKNQITEVINTFPFAKNWLWVQEEPANMGAWPFIMRHFTEKPLLLVARPESGSPAGGSSVLHKIRQKKIINKAFGEGCCEKQTEECKMLCAPTESQFLPEQLSKDIENKKNEH